MAPKAKKEAGGIASLLNKRVMLIDHRGADQLTDSTIILRSVEPEWVGLEIDGHLGFCTLHNIGALKEHKEQPTA